MKILLLNQTFYPDSMATSQQVTDLALYLASLGHQVTVVTDRADYETRQAVYPAYEVYRGVAVHRVRATSYGKRSFAHRIVDGVSFNLAVIFRLLRLPRQDVVISFTSPPLIGVLGTVYAVLSRARSVQWLMDVNPDAAIAVGYLDPKKLPTRLLTAIFELSLRRSAHVVVLDRWMKERIVAHGVEPEKIAIVPPWPAHDAVTADELPLREKNLFRNAHDLGDKFVVMYSGNHSIVHPLDTLLDAAVRLKDAGDIRFVFVGGGLREGDVTACVGRHDLKNVIQLPRQPRNTLCHSLAAADLHVVVLGNAVAGLVHASKVYGILAVGAPYVFIGPGRSHIADLLAECPSGYHVEHGDAESLVRSIREAQRLTSGDRQELARKSIRHMSSRYAPKLALDAFARQVLKPLSGGEEAAPTPAEAL